MRLCYTYTDDIKRTRCTIPARISESLSVVAADSRSVRWSSAGTDTIYSVHRSGDVQEEPADVKVSPNVASSQQLYIELSSDQHAPDLLCTCPDSVEPRIPQYSTHRVIWTCKSALTNAPSKSFLPFIYPFPPRHCIASNATSTAFSVEYKIAPAQSLGVGTTVGPYNSHMG